jgi:outer membrane protein assembly factor BamB
MKVGRLTGAPGNYYASPVAVDGKIYCVSQSGTVSIVKAGRNWELLASAALDEDCFATPALANGRVYVRTEASVFCFGQLF